MSDYECVSIGTRTGGSLTDVGIVLDVVAIWFRTTILFCPVAFEVLQLGS